MPDNLLIAILAAGASRRLGQPKQLVTLNSEPLIHRQCRIALEANIGPVLAILGCSAEACTAAVADLAVAVCINDQWQEGLAASIRQAVRTAIDQRASGLILVQVDQYQLTSSDLRALRDAWVESSGVKGCRAQAGEYLGPPVIIPRSCFEEALELHGEQGARRVLERLGPMDLIDVPLPNAAADLDLPEQLKAPPFTLP